MPTNTEKSPAVVSIEREQASQRASQAKGDLDTGLEDSFPASDPVSMISTGIPAGRTDTDEATRVHTNADAYNADGAGERRPPVSNLLADIGKVVTENPLTAVGFVAAIAFVWGATR
jgi:hypothetical protein